MSILVHSFRSPSLAPTSALLPASPTMRYFLSVILLALVAISGANGLATNKSVSRVTFFRDVARSAAAAVAAAGGPRPAFASSDPELKPKLTNVSDEELKKIITADIVERSFLVSADLTREVYDESSSFIDEIDKYPMHKWIKGTKRLFVAEKSRVDLVGDVKVSPDKVEFRFDEDLMFRIPLRPVVSITGRVVLDRNPESGLITQYQEFWDQDVGTVLKSAKF